VSSNRYVPRSIQNIFDRLEARNERSDKESFSTELPKVFQVIVYDSATPEVRSPTSQPHVTTATSTADNFYKYRARSLAGHNDLQPAPETATFRGEYERLRNAHFQAIVRKNREEGQFPETGEVWMATHLGGNLVELTSFVRYGTFTLSLLDGNGPAQNAHTNGQNPTTSVGAATASATTTPTAASTQLALDIVSAYQNCTPELANKIVEVAIRLGTHPYYLANLINFESARTFSAAKDNGVAPDSAGIGYIGLIQFGNSAVADFKARKDPNISKTKLKNMTEVEQMDWVEFYLQMPHKRKGSDYKSSIDLYMAVFYPAAVGNPNYTFPANVVTANNGIDTPTEYARRANSGAKLPYNIPTPWNLS
jgi:hypothetical protein